MTAGIMRLFSDPKGVSTDVCVEVETDQAKSRLSPG